MLCCLLLVHIVDTQWRSNTMGHISRALYSFAPVTFFYSLRQCFHVIHNYLLLSYLVPTSTTSLSLPPPFYKSVPSFIVRYCLRFENIFLLRYLLKSLCRHYLGDVMYILPMLVIFSFLFKHKKVLCKDFLTDIAKWSDNIENK